MHLSSVVIYTCNINLHNILCFSEWMTAHLKLKYSRQRTETRNNPADYANVVRDTFALGGV